MLLLNMSSWWFIRHVWCNSHLMFVCFLDVTLESILPGKGKVNIYDGCEPSACVGLNLVFEVKVCSHSSHL